jgi:hypothetical protein
MYPHAADSQLKFSRVACSQDYNIAEKYCPKINRADAHLLDPDNIHPFCGIFMTPKHLDGIQYNQLSRAGKTCWQALMSNKGVNKEFLKRSLDFPAYKALDLIVVFREFHIPNIPVLQGNRMDVLDLLIQNIIQIFDTCSTYF